MYLNNVGKEIVSWLKVIVVGVLFAIVINKFIFTPVSVKGASMMPTYEDRDRVVVNKIGKAISDFERFDVIVFKASEDKDYIKRIIGLPGDHVAYEDDVLYVNGKKYDEPYLDQYKSELTDKGDLTFDFTLEEVAGVSEIPEDSYFVLGDHRRISNDSRYPSVGLIKDDDILGKVSFRYYPFH